jgi:hypothetical protein
VLVLFANLALEQGGKDTIPAFPGRNSDVLVRIPIVLAFHFGIFFLSLLTIEVLVRNNLSGFLIELLRCRIVGGKDPRLTHQDHLAVDRIKRGTRRMIVMVFVGHHPDILYPRAHGEENEEGAQWHFLSDEGRTLRSLRITRRGHEEVEEDDIEVRTSGARRASSFRNFLELFLVGITRILVLIPRIEVSAQTSFREHVRLDLAFLLIIHLDRERLHGVVVRADDGEVVALEQKLGRTAVIGLVVNNEDVQVGIHR